MRILLRDLSPGQDYAIQFQASNTQGETSPWSPVYRFRTAGDVIAPGPPTGLTWAATGSSFLGRWNAPSLDGNGAELRDFKDYEVTVSSGATSRVFYITSTTFELTLAQNQQVFGSVQSTVTISVKARDHSGNKSTSVSATATEDNPPVPSTPTITYLRGQIVVNWDGNPATGIRNDLTLNHVEIHASPTTGFAPSDSTIVGRFEGSFPGPQSFIITALNYDVPTYIKLVAVNRLGRKSDASAQAVGTSQRLTGLDIGNGEIGVDQINFADQLGGVRSFYEPEPPEPPDFNPVNGDIWYDVDHPTEPYRPYKRVDGLWVHDPNINMISGTRIVAGTITSDQIGTNLIITSSANIGSAVIDSANISFLNGDKITAGTIQSTSLVNYGGGASRPAWSLALNGDAFLNNANVRGHLVIGNSGDSASVRAASLVRSFDYIANTAGWAIKGDGTVEFNNGTFRGQIIGASIVGSTYKTSETGRRIELGASGALGTMKFIAPDNTTTEIGAFTAESASGNTEAIRIGVVDNSASQLWKKIQIQGDGGINAWSAYNHITIGGGGSFQSFVIFYTPNKGSSTTPLLTGTTRLVVDQDQFYVNDKFGKNRFLLDVSGTNRITQDHSSVSGAVGTVIQQWSDANRTSTQDRVWINSNGSNIFTHMAGGMNLVQERQSNGTLSERVVVLGDRIRWRPATLMLGSDNASAFAELHDRFNVNTSPQLKLFTAYHNGVVYGGAFRYALNLDTLSNPRMEMVNIASTGYEPLWAASFVQNSDEAGKREIRELGSGQTERVRRIRPIKYTRKRSDDIPEVETTGFSAQQVQSVMPEAVLDGGEGSGLAVDLTVILAELVSSVGELADRIDTIDGILAKRRGEDK